MGTPLTLRQCTLMDTGVILVTRQQILWPSLLLYILGFKNRFGKASVRRVQWFWILARPDLREYWHAGRLQPPQPQPEADEQVLRELRAWQASTTPKSSLCLQLKTVSCNVFTLSKKYVSSLAAAVGFLDQCHGKDIAVVALQETRLKRTRLGHSDYIVVAHPSLKGKGGVLLALHRRLLRIDGEHGPKEALAEKHISVVASTHELLIVRVWYGSLDVLMVVAHAPHTGRPFAEVEAFWGSIATSIPAYLKSNDMLVFADANGRLGSRTSEAVQGCNAEEENPNGACFHEFLQTWRLWVPATFDAFHTGPGFTWTHPNGGQSRIDYIAVPVRWFFSWTDLQPAHGHLHDHHAVCLEFQCHLEGRDACQHVQRPVSLQHLGEAAVAQEQMARVSHMPPIDWAMDVHQHAHELTKRFSSGVHAVVPKRLPFHRKLHFSAVTRRAILHKAHLRGRLLRLEYGRRLLLLRACFAAWRTNETEMGQMLTDMGQEDRHLACTWVSLFLTFRRVRNSATALQRYDTQVFFDALKDEWHNCDQPGKTKELWTLVKRHLPRHKTRQHARPAVQHEELRDQWRPHLERLEAGASVRLETLYQELLSDDPPFEASMQMCALEEIPPLVQVKNSLRATRPGKAAGPEGLPSEWIHAGADSLAPWVFDLILKMILTTQEPIPWKGGILQAFSYFG